MTFNDEEYSDFVKGKSYEIFNSIFLLVCGFDVREVDVRCKTHDDP